VTPLAGHAIAMNHPSSILRQRTNGDRHGEMAQFIADLQVAAALLNRRGPV
jgi:hypothetical protein